MRARPLLGLILVALGWARGGAGPILLAADPEELFEARIRPVLVGTCIGCHGPAKAGGGLRLDSREAILRGGDGGEIVDLEEPAASRLLTAIAREPGESAMPPDRNLALRVDQVADFQRWIREGLIWPADRGTLTSRQHWAFEPLRETRPPTVVPRSEPGTWIDDYLAERQLAAGLTPGPAARPEAWLRRLAFDLTGLPPEPELVRQFLADPSPEARGVVVERLLASPAYGERWGRHWLDVVRYADTAGETADYPIPQAWRYRNRVVAAFNRDEPWDQFLRDQIAGDLAPRPGPVGPGTGAADEGQFAERVTATGLLALSRRFGFDSENYHHLTIQDSIDTVGQAVLGLSWGCARCHDHKFDPVSMRDYYGLYGIFASSRYPFPGSEQKQKVRTLAALVPPARAVAEWEGHVQRTVALVQRLQASQRPVPPVILRVLEDFDGDFELQAPAAGGSNGVLVPPWQFTGAVSVTTAAQSPHRNRPMLGARVGASVAGGEGAYTIDQVLPPARRWSGRGLARFTADFRVAPAERAETGPHRLRLGPQVGPPLVELWIEATRVSLRESAGPVPVAEFVTGEWVQLVVDFDGDRGTVAVSAGRPDQPTGLPARPVSPEATWRLDRVTWDLLDSNRPHAPLDIDQLSLTVQSAAGAGSPGGGSPPGESEFTSLPELAGLPDLGQLQRDLRAELGQDGDLELQGVGQGLVAPWNPGPNSVVKLTAAAQSPFENVHPRGGVGLELPARAEYDGFGWSIPGIDVASSPTWSASFEIRPGTPPANATGSWRYYIGHGAGPAPGVELHFTATELLVPGEPEFRQVARLQPDEWQQVQLTIDPRARRYRGVVYRGEERQDFEGEMSKKWDGQFDYSFIDSYGHRPGVRPPLQVDNFQLTSQRLLAPGEPAPAAPTGGNRERQERIARLREQVREGERAWSRAEAELGRSLIEGPYPLAYAMGEGTPHDEAVHLRGEPGQPGPVVSRALPPWWGGGPLPEGLAESGRRELAEWLTAPGNPLTPRVFVNRIWQQHFGRGLVKTPNDFGVRGQPPTHPELLDALARGFVAHGWSVKWLHRQIVLSAAWGRAIRGAEQGPASPAEVDAYTHFVGRRLSAEELRDALLRVTGELDAGVAEGHPFPVPAAWGFSQHAPFQAVYGHNRRSVYLMTQRLKRHPYLALFDGPDPNASTPLRSESIVPTQALFFLNDPLVHDLSLRWARRLLASPGELRGALARAIWEALGRAPDPLELEEGLVFVAEHRAAQRESGGGDEESAAVAAWLRSLLSSNEFVHVD